MKTKPTYRESSMIDLYDQVLTDEEIEATLGASKATRGKEGGKRRGKSSSGSNGGLPRPDLDKGEKFIRGHLPPILFYRAARLRGRALAVYLVLWHEAGFKEDPVVKLSNSNRWMMMVGISRYSKKRALDALEHDGLISVERSEKASPVVTILGSGNNKEKNDVGENE